MLLRPCITSTSTTTATVSVSSVGDDRSALGKRLLVYTEQAIPPTFSNPPLLRSPFGEHSHKTLISSHFPSIQRGSSTYFCASPPCHQFSNRVPLGLLTIQPKQESAYNHMLAVSPFTQSEQPSAFLKVLPTVKISFHNCPSEMSWRGTVMLQLLPSSDVCILTICHSGSSLLFLC